MMNVLEGNLMVNPINDSNSFKHLETEFTFQHREGIRAETSSIEKNQVNLSPASKQLTSLKEHIQSIDVFDETRIDNIKQQLLDGHYAISNETIAKRMLEHMLISE